MLDKKKLLVLNILFSVFMVFGITLLIYTFVYEQSLINKKTDGIIITFDAGIVNDHAQKLHVLYGASISSIICIFVMSIFIAFTNKKHFYSKAIWITQILGGLIIITSILMIKDNLKKQGGKNV